MARAAPSQAAVRECAARAVIAAACRDPHAALQDTERPSLSRAGVFCASVPPVVTTARKLQIPVDDFAEKGFYLDEFRAHTLCFSLTARDWTGRGAFDRLAALIRELIDNDTHLLLLVGVDTADGGGDAALQQVRRRVQRALLGESAPRTISTTARLGARDLVANLSAAPNLEARLETIWNHLRRAPLLFGLLPERELIAQSQLLASRLRVPKWVVAEAAGGIAAPTGEPISFMDDDLLSAILQAGTAEWAGLAARRATLHAVRAALRSGVTAVNLCALDQIARELFTYEGSGTLFTLEDYCRVERLGIDDFEEVERLLERGHREGYLKPRDEAEIAQILLNGFGATIGTHHLAGVCGLLTERYRGDRAAEISGLYTVTRFKSEGVGARLLARATAEARDMGLDYVFACTVDERAATFFRRHGFAPVGTGDVPAAKWKGYDADRRSRLQVLRCELSADSEAAPAP